MISCPRFSLHHLIIAAFYHFFHQQNNYMIDLFQERRALSSKKRALAKNVLPELKYSPTLSRKLNDELICSHPASLLYNYQPLSSLLVSKKLSTPSPSLSHPHHFKIRKESLKKMPEKDQQFEQQSLRLHSTSLKVGFQHEEKAEEGQRCRQKEGTFMVVRGNNNEELVRQVLLVRGWREGRPGEGVDLRWLFDKGRFDYKKKSWGKRRGVNHFEGNQEVSSKDQLVKNLQIYCETKGIQVFSLTPVTFLLDFDDQYCLHNLKQFLGFFLKHDPRTTKKTNWPASLVNHLHAHMAWQNTDIKKKMNVLSRPLGRSTYYSPNSYLWLLKPTGLNRGRGIQIFDSLEQLQRVLIEYLSRFRPAKATHHSTPTKDKIPKDGSLKDRPSSRTIERGDKEEEEKGVAKFAGEGFTLKSCSFVVQKYVQRPFLLKGRKFDIRVWVLVTEDLRVYFFREGYIRTSTEAYSTEDASNPFIHLTNNAIQKYSSSYGQFEEGNQLSFWNLKRELKQAEVEAIWSRIKEITFMTFNSVKRKINPNQRTDCFEIFGLDYIIDEELKVWLIEVNENPCLECSSPLLGQLIPRLLDDAFSLVLDPSLEPRHRERPYKVEGYRNDQNLWQQLGQLVPNGEYSPPKVK